MVDSCARNTAQLLLKMAAGFKQHRFAGEREWRIVCAPFLGRNSSAPSLLDEKFAVNIKSGPRAHVALQIARPWRILEAATMPPVPFVDWACSSRIDRAAIEGINRTLRSHGRPDLGR